MSPIHIIIELCSLAVIQLLHNTMGCVCGVGVGVTLCVRRVGFRLFQHNEGIHSNVITITRGLSNFQKQINYVTLERPLSAYS